MASRIIPSLIPDYNPISISYRAQDSRHSCAFCEHITGSHRTGYYCSALAETLRELGAPVEQVRIDQRCTGICECYECNETEFYKEFGEYPGEGGVIDLDAINGVRRGIDYPASM